MCSILNLPLKENGVQLIHCGKEIILVQPGLDLWSALRAGQAGVRGLFGCNTQWVSCLGGLSSQSVSVVKLIKAGGRRRSSREQVPLAVEPSSSVALSLTVVLPALLPAALSRSLLIFTDFQQPPELSAPLLFLHPRRLPLLKSPPVLSNPAKLD